MLAQHWAKILQKTHQLLTIKSSPITSNKKLTNFVVDERIGLRSFTEFISLAAHDYWDTSGLRNHGNQRRANRPHDVTIG